MIKKEQRKASAEQKYAEQVATGLEERKKMVSERLKEAAKG